MILMSRKKRRAMIAQLCLIQKSLADIVDASNYSTGIIRKYAIAEASICDLTAEIGGIDGLLKVKDYTISGQKERDRDAHAAKPVP